MGIPIIGDVIDAVGDLASEFIEDKDKRNELQVRLEELRDKADERASEEILAQIELNKTEAQSGSVFVAGWRPFVGWVGGVSLAYSAIMYPLLSWLSRVCGYGGELPVLDNTLLITIMTGMLGLGTQRMMEKKWKVSTNDYRSTPDYPVPTPIATPAKPKKKILGITLPEKAPWA